MKTQENISETVMGLILAITGFVPGIWMMAQVWLAYYDWFALPAFAMLPALSLGKAYGLACLSGLLKYSSIKKFSCEVKRTTLELGFEMWLTSPILYLFGWIGHHIVIWLG